MSLYNFPEGTKVEVSRSFSKTVQVAPYEPVNFFCSQKVEVLESEAALAGRELSNRCVIAVENAIADYIETHPIKH